MSMFPHTITLYTVTENEVTFEPEVNITVLRGVLCDASKAVNVRESGMEGADAVNLYVPFSVDAVDGVNLMAKKYLSPAFYRDASSKDGVWTLDPEHTFFVKGEIVEPDRDFKYINGKYDDVYRITSIDAKDFGGDMAHWEIGGA